MQFQLLRDTTFDFMTKRYYAFAFSLSIITSVLRGIDSGATNRAFEDPLQMTAGAISGFVTGALVGLGYTLFQRPNCGYGGSLFCW
jgi:hypothetical protein